jgi:hypothetical protein
MTVVNGMLGKGPKREDPRTLKLADFVNRSTLPDYPAALDWTMKGGATLLYPMNANDVYGCCVFASAAHQIGTWSGQTGAQEVPPEADVLDAYSRFTGFRPDDPATDNGAVMLDVANRWRKESICGHTIDCFVEVDQTDDQLMTSAAYLFGGLWTGWDLPAAWQNEPDEWTTGPSLSGQWAPRSWGGHAMHGAAPSPLGFPLRTWGGMRFATWAAAQSYCTEAFAIMPNGLWAVADRAPSGLDLEALRAALEAVTR